MLTEKYNRIEQIEEVMNFTYPGITLLIRDTNLGDLASKYEVGMIIRELGFTDASLRRGGMVTTHRIAILSNHYANMQAYEHGTHWGLCVIDSGAHFKVLDRYSVGDKTQIVLLHLPEKGWEVFEKAETDVDRDVVQMVREGFEHYLQLPPIPELSRENWLSRCRYPLGMTESGDYFPLGEY